VGGAALIPRDQKGDQQAETDYEREEAHLLTVLGNSKRLVKNPARATPAPNQRPGLVSRSRRIRNTATRAKVWFARLLWCDSTGQRWALGRPVGVDDTSASWTLNLLLGSYDRRLTPLRR
jgi:hypothetical protein